MVVVWRRRPLSNGHQDVPVFTISRGMDNILSAYAVCPKLEENIAGFFNSTAFHVSRSLTPAPQEAPGVGADGDAPCLLVVVRQAKANETHALREYLASNFNMSKELYYMPFIYDRSAAAAGGQSGRRAEQGLTGCVHGW